MKDHIQGNGFNHLGLKASLIE